MFQGAIRTWVGVGAWLTAAAGSAVTSASAQSADAHVVPRGLLRISFEPHYTNYDRRFALGSPLVPDGELEFLGADLTADTVGTNLFPALAPVEQAIRDLTGNPSYRINIGRFSTVRDADLRRFPFNFAVGLTDRLTITASLPIVTHRSQITFDADSTDANVGFNQAITSVAEPGNPAQVTALLGELTTAVAAVRAAIAAGSFGCPGSGQCALATAAADRGDALLMNLSVLAGVGGDPNFATVAPLAGSAQAAAIVAEVNAVSAELVTYGGSAISASYPFPTDGFGDEAVNGNLFADPSLGYSADPLDFIRGTSLGDLEVGFRFGALQHSAIRLVVLGHVRFPTATLDRPQNYIDFGTGDRQLDLEGGFEAALNASGTLGLSVSGTFVYQAAHTLERRLGPPSIPIRPASSQTLVSRNPGEIVRVAAYPTLRLADGFRVFGSISYYRKAPDAYTRVGPVDTIPPASPVYSLTSLSEESEMRALSFGGGVAYRSTYMPGGGMPIEAGVHYQSAFSGSGGLTPKANQLRLYLRLYRNLFAPSPPAPPPAEASDPRTAVSR